MPKRISVSNLLAYVEELVPKILHLIRTAIETETQLLNDKEKLQVVFRLPRELAEVKIYTFFVKHLFRLNICKKEWSCWCQM